MKICPTSQDKILSHDEGEGGVSLRGHHWTETKIPSPTIWALGRMRNLQLKLSLDRVFDL